MPCDSILPMMLQTIVPCYIATPYVTKFRVVSHCIHNYHQTQDSGHPLRSDRNFLYSDWTWKPRLSKVKVQNSPVDCFVGNGGVHQVQDASQMGVDRIWICLMLESIVTDAFSKSPTRTLLFIWGRCRTRRCKKRACGNKTIIGIIFLASVFMLTIAFCRNWLYNSENPRKSGAEHERKANWQV